MADIPGRSRRDRDRRRFGLVDGFAGRRSVIPFAILVLSVLGVGLLALLMINTALDQGAFTLQAAQQRGTDLTDQEQQLQQELAASSAPGALASQAAALGMVPNPQPAFLNPTDGVVAGVPSPAPTTARPSPSPSPSASLSASLSASASPARTAPASAAVSASPSAAGSASPRPTP